MAAPSVLQECGLVVTPPQTPASPRLSIAAGLRSWSPIPLFARSAVALVIGATAWFVYTGGGWSASRATGDWLSQTWQSRPVRLYRPSFQHADYNLNFEAHLNEGSVGWVFRATDSQHYYAVKLELVKGVTSPAVAITRFTVIGEKKTQIHRLGPVVPRPWEPQRISFKAAGPLFSLRIGDQLVDAWVDDTLRSGGLGFLSENGERREEMHSVQILFPASGTGS